VDRICGSADFAGWPFRVGMAYGLGVRPEEIGNRQGQRHREICSAGSVGIVAWIQFRSRRRTARDSPRAFGRRGKLHRHDCAPGAAVTGVARCKGGQLLREYVPLRIEAHREGQFSDQFATTRKRTADLQDRMWAEAVAAAAERPSSITASFIASLNETIDLEAKRVAAKRNHVPGAVWLLLLSVAGCGLWLVSYQAGTSGRHSILERFVFPILIAIVIAIITDIDTPRGGLVSLGERPLLELNETLSRASATTTP
jgi:hypothetical protein